MVSVTDQHGKPVHGLGKKDFKVHWVVDNSTEIALKNWTVAEYTGSGTVPKLPGVYDVELFSDGAQWTPLNSNRYVFFVAVHAPHGQGQTLHPASDPNIAL